MERNKTEIEKLSEIVLNERNINTDDPIIPFELSNVLSSAKRDISQLSRITNFTDVGEAFLCILIYHIFDEDIDNQQIAASIGYWCLSKSILNNGDNRDIIACCYDRVMLLRFAKESFIYTIEVVLKKTGRYSDDMLSPDSFTLSVDAAHALYAMQLSDIESNPMLYIKVPKIRTIREEIHDMIYSYETFYPLKDVSSVVGKGIQLHKDMFAYLNKCFTIDKNIPF